MEIPFNQVAVVGNEWEYTRSVVESGQIGGGGVFTRRCEELLEHVLGAPRVLLTTSGTHALELAAMLLEPEAVDEVILPSFTFVSTANAFRRAGARLVFADVQPDTLNLDAADVARKMTERTRCIVPVHYAGVGCELDELSELAEQSGARIIEDNAHGLLGSFKGRPLGTHGWMATLSFHSTKNFTCGEGGALVINDPAQIERAEILREKGTNRSQFFRGEVDKYTWLEVGSSYPPSEILAAFLLAQLENRERIQNRRRELWQRYFSGLTDWAEQVGARLPSVPNHCDQAFHMFYMLLVTPEQRTDFIAHLRLRQIQAVFHYLPLHSSPMGRQLNGREGQCPVTEWVSDRLVRLPFFYALTDEVQQRIIDAILEFDP